MTPSDKKDLRASPHVQITFTMADWLEYLGDNYTWAGVGELTPANMERAMRDAKLLTQKEQTNDTK